MQTVKAKSDFLAGNGSATSSVAVLNSAPVRGFAPLDGVRVTNTGDTNSLYIGPTGDLAADGTRGAEVLPGDSVFINVDDLRKVSIVSPDGTTFSWVST